MPTLPQSVLTKSDADYGRVVRGLTHKLWAGEIDFYTFVSGMVDSIYFHYEKAWREGARQCGVSPADRTATEAQQLQWAITADIQSIMGFADFVGQHTKAEGWKLASVMPRAELWSNRYKSIVTFAQVTACTDKKLTWRFGATEEHCADCARYNGRTYRATVWAEWGAIPRSHRLECGGWRCDCRLDPTTAPVTPGHPPMPSGG